MEYEIPQRAYDMNKAAKVGYALLSKFLIRAASFTAISKEYKRSMETRRSFHFILLHDHIE